MNARKHDAVVVGASAGALEALSSLLPALPRDFPLAILIVVHLPPDKNSALAEILGRKCKLAVREAQDKEPIAPATIYVAPPDYHLLVEPNLRLSLSADEPVMFSRPSIDVLFETAADAYGSRLLGIVLTGGNSDGAKGLQAIFEAGGIGWVQDPKTANTRAMPEAALKACPHALSLTLEQMAARLSEAAHG